MPASPADIAKYTTDGTVITASSTTIRDAHSDAEDLGGEEIEMFTDSIADGQILLDERFALRSQLAAIHEAVEVETSLGLGITIAIAPTVPCFRLVDEKRSMDKTVRTRAYAHETGSERFSVEVIE